jgi:hypothetical protein
MHKVKTRNRLDLIDCVEVQSVVALHLYKGGGLDPLQVVSRANPAVLANKSCKKLGTLIDSVHMRTVCTTTVDHPDHEPSGLRTGPSVRHFSALNICPCLLVEVDKPKAYVLSLMRVTGFSDQ